MIDTHCHILWGVDDASSTASQALDMIRIAQADGIKVIVATSHIKYPVYPNTYEKLQQALVQLQQAIKAADLQMEVVIGAENFVNHRTIDFLEQDKFVTYQNAGNYILVEFAWTKNQFDHPTQYLKRIVNKGMIPVVAHPERYEWVHEDYGLVKTWREMGCLMQVNRTSILGFDKIAQANVCAKRLLDDDMVDIIASDAHSPFAPRYPKLSDVYKYVEARYGKERADLYCLINPAKIIDYDLSKV